MSVEKALELQLFLTNWRERPQRSPEPVQPFREALKAFQLGSGSLRDLLALCEKADDQEREVFTEQLFLCHFRGGREAALPALLDVLLTPALVTRPYPRALAAAVALDPAFRCPAAADRLPGEAIVLLPCGAPWGGREGLLRRWDQVLSPRFYPALDRNAPLPDSRDANGYPGLLTPADPLFRLDPARDLPELLEQYLRTCSVVGTPPADRLSVLGEALARSLPLPTLLAACGPGGVLRQESPAALRAFALGADCSVHRRETLLQALEG